MKREVADLSSKLRWKEPKTGVDKIPQKPQEEKPTIKPEVIPQKPQGEQKKELHSTGNAEDI